MMLERKSPLPTTASKLRTFWGYTLGHVTLGLGLLCLGRLYFLRLLLILGCFYPLLNFTENNTKLSCLEQIGMLLKD